MMPGIYSPSDPDVRALRHRNSKPPRQPTIETLRLVSVEALLEESGNGDCTVRADHARLGLTEQLMLRSLDWM